MKTNSCPTQHRFTLRLAFFLLALWLALPDFASAATKTWDGSASGFWATGANWVGGVAPVAGDELVFPAGVTRKAVTNNFAGASFRSIEIADEGYSLRGNALQLTGNGDQVILVYAPGTDGAAVVALDITLAGAAGYREIHGGTGGADRVLVLSGDISLNGHDLRSRHLVSFTGGISGDGGVTAVTGETIFLGSTPNTYTGDTVSAVATLKLQKPAGVTAVPGRLVASGGTIEWASANQVSDTAELALGNGSALLAGHAETVASMSVSDQGVIHGGTLTVAGNLRFQRGHNGLLGSGRISFPSGAHHLICTNSTNDITIELTGPGDLVQVGLPPAVTGFGAVHLFAANTFTGTYTVSNSTLYPRHAQALGTGFAGTFALPGNNASVVLLDGVEVVGETLVASGFGTSSRGKLVAENGHGRWRGNVILPDADSGITLGTDSNTDTLTIDGVISGVGSILTSDNAAGTYVFAGSQANTYSGETHLARGRLELRKTVGPAVPGDLILGANVAEHPTDGVALFGHQQIGNDAEVTFFHGGMLFLNGFNETVRDIVLLGGTHPQLAGGTLTLNGNLKKYSSDSVNLAAPGRLHLSSFVEHEFFIGENPASNELLISCEISGAASILKTGNRALRLAAANTFAGNLTVGEGTVEVRHPLALGATTAGTIVSNGATLLLDQAGLAVANEPLELRGHGFNSLGALRVLENATWSGNVSVTEFGSVAVAASKTLTMSGAITAPEQLWKRGDGRLVFSGTGDNSFAGGFVLKDGTLDLAKTAGAVALAGFAFIGEDDEADEEVCQLINGNQIDPGLLLHIPPTGRVRLNGFNATVSRLSGFYTDNGGIVELGAATLTVDTTDPSGFWGGLITGTGGFTKRGSGDVVFLSDNTYTGPTLVQQGTLRVRSHQPQSPVLVMAGARLTGDGTVGHVTVNNGGTVLPGYFSATVASLTCSNLVMQPGSTNYARIIGEDGYTALNVRGTVMLNQPTLNLQEDSFFPITKPYLPKLGDVIIPIVNDGNEAVTGTFAGLPPGQFTGYGGLQWSISYSNDVVLWVGSQGLASSATGGSNYLDVLVTGGNGDAYLDPNECAELRIPVFNETSSNLPPFTALLTCDVPGVTVHQAFAQYPALAPGQGAYGSNVFRITTPPGLFCGSNLPVSLVIHAGDVVYQLPVDLFVGAPEMAARFDATDVPDVINDGVTTEVALNVDDFPGWLARVEVEVHLTHPLTEDLHLTLVAPDDTEVPLSVKAGVGANYGAGCADGQRTRFTMAAPQFVGGAASPFTGAFRPAGNLNVFRTRSGSDVAGKWKLRIYDDTHLNTGSLLCWSLFLSPTTCTDGGGACDVCPGLASGDVDDTDPVTPQFVFSRFEPSPGYTNDVCPGVFISPQHYSLHNYSNHLAHAVSVTATLTTECTNNVDEIYASAFAGVFNPDDACAGYLGTSGYPYSLGTRTFTFIAPPHTNIQILVTSQGGEGCKGYTLHVDAVGLCPVTLNIAALATNTMRLDWPSHAIGYELQRTSTLLPLNWANVPTPPVKTGTRFVVTNEVADPNGFYRLRKP